MTKTVKRPGITLPPLPEIDNVTRREFLIGAAGLLLLPAGCGGEEAGEKRSGETRIVQDANGNDVEVPVDPRRIVALGEVELDSLLALGIEPAGTLPGRGQPGPPNYLGEEAEGIPLLGTLGEPNLEAIATLEPDLILASFPFESALENLRGITPATVVSSAAGEPWQESLQRIGDAVNESDAAEQELANYEQSVEDARADLGEHVGGAVSIVRWQAEGPIVMSPDVFAGLVVQDLGLEPIAAPRQQSGHPHSPPLSLEELDQIDADCIFVGTLGGADEDAEALESIQGDPLWQQLEAVQNGHVVSVDGSLWTSIAGPLGARQIIASVLEGVVE